MKTADKRQVLVDRYLDFYSLAFAILRDESDAGDAVQDAVVETLTHNGVNDPANYCFKAVRNSAINILRRRRRLQRMEEMEVAAEERKDDLLQRVVEARDGLDEERRALMMLHYEEGYTYADLAALTGTSKSTIRRLFDDAKQEIKTKVEREI